MSKVPTVLGVARELRLSGWVFGIFAVLSAVIAVLDFLNTRRLEGGWPVAVAVALVAWIGVIHFAGQLKKTQQTKPNGDTDAL